MAALNKLLQESLQHVDTGNLTDTPPMDPTRRAELDAILQSMHEGSPEVQIKAALTILQSGDADVSTLLQALEVLEFETEQIDAARDFVKMGGLPAVTPYLGHVDPQVRAGVGGVLGTCSQNNPTVQESMLADGLVVKVLDALKAEGDPAAAQKQLLTLSCLCRGNAPAAAEFRSVGGWTTLTSLWEHPSPKLRRKATFMAQALLTEMGSDAEGLVLSVPILPAIAGLIRGCCKEGGFDIDVAQPMVEILALFQAPSADLGGAFTAAGLPAALSGLEDVLKGDPDATAVLGDSLGAVRRAFPS